MALVKKVQCEGKERWEQCYNREGCNLLVRSNGQHSFGLTTLLKHDIKSRQHLF